MPPEPLVPSSPRRPKRCLGHPRLVNAVNWCAAWIPRRPFRWSPQEWTHWQRVSRQTGEPLHTPIISCCERVLIDFAVPVRSLKKDYLHGNFRSNEPNRTPHRRLLRWTIGVLLLLIGAVLGYPSRPLNAVERKIVGTWKFDHHESPILIVFASDRTFRFRNPGDGSSGSWSASDDQICSCQTVHSHPSGTVESNGSCGIGDGADPGSQSIVELSDKRFVMKDPKDLGVRTFFDRVPNDE